MKRIGIFLITLIIALIAVAPMAQAQDYQNPNDFPSYYFFGNTPANNKAYRSKIDTLTQATLGGAGTVSYIVHSSDTMKADIYLDYKLRNRSTWTQAYADSFIAVRDTTFEYIFRSHTVDRIGGFGRVLRVRVAQRTTSDYDSTTTYTSEFIWKP